MNWMNNVRLPPAEPFFPYNTTGQVTNVNTATEKHVIWKVKLHNRRHDDYTSQCSDWFSVPFAPNFKACLSIEGMTVYVDIDHVQLNDFKFQLTIMRQNGSKDILLSQTSTRFFSNIDLSDAMDANGFLTFKFAENNFTKRQQDVLVQFFEEEAFTDFTFIVEGREIKVSKLILATRSDVFRKMFETNMQEKKQGKVDIVDVTYSGFRSLVKFIYSSKLEAKDLETDILVAADKYNVVDVKQAYTELALKSLKKENIDEMMILAHKHNLEELLEKCFKMINSNNENKEVIKKLLARCDKIV